MTPVVLTLLVVCSTLSVLLLSVLCHTIYQFYTVAENKAIDTKVKVITICIIICALLFCILSTIQYSIWFIPVVSKAVLSCYALMIAGELCWVLSKVLMCILFTVKLDITFGESSLRIKKRKLRCVQALIVASLLVLYIFYILQIKTVLFIDNEHHLCVYDDHFYHAHGHHFVDGEHWFPWVFPPYYTVVAFTALYIIYAVLSLYWFLIKLHRILKLRRAYCTKTRNAYHISDHPWMKQRDKQLQGIMAKHTILVTVSVVCTAVLVAAASQTWIAIALLPLDAFVNAICIYFLYRFTHKYFIFLCCCNGCKCLQLKRYKHHSPLRRNDSRDVDEDNDAEMGRQTLQRRSISAQQIIQNVEQKKRQKPSSHQTTESMSISKETDDVDCKETELDDIDDRNQANDVDETRDYDSQCSNDVNVNHTQKLRSLLESIVFHAEFECIVFEDEEKDTIESAEKCSLQSTHSDARIHHVRFNSNRSHIMKRTDIAMHTINEDDIITPKNNRTADGMMNTPSIIRINPQRMHVHVVEQDNSGVNAELMQPPEI